MTENFWGYIVNGITEILVWIVSVFPLAQQSALIQSAPTIVFYAFAPLLVFAGSFMNLTVFSSGAVIILGAEVFRVAAAIWRFILKLIPAAN